MQHTHESTPFLTKEHQITLLCDGLESPANVGAIFRLCDAFGVEEIIFNQEPDLTSNRLKRTARTTERTIPFRTVTDLNDALLQLKEKEYLTVALEITNQSNALSSIRTQLPNKIALVIGNERQGVSERILKQVQEVVHIEMFGKNSSMNVAQATAIALYELTKH